MEAVSAGAQENHQMICGSPQKNMYLIKTETDVFESFKPPKPCFYCSVHPDYCDSGIFQFPVFSSTSA